MQVQKSGIWYIVASLGAARPLRLINGRPSRLPEENDPIKNLIAELRRRRVFRVIVLYAIAGWVVIEVASTVLPGLNLPDWTTTLVIVLVALGFIVAVMLGWAFDIGPRGIERTEAEPTGSTPERPPAEAGTTLPDTTPEASRANEPTTAGDSAATRGTASSTQADARRSIAGKHEPAIIYNIGCLHCQFGETEEALSYLERAVDHGYGHRRWLENDSDLVLLRDHPRFQALLERMS